MLSYVCDALPDLTINDVGVDEYVSLMENNLPVSDTDVDQDPTSLSVDDEAGVIL